MIFADFYSDIFFRKVARCGAYNLKIYRLILNCTSTALGTSFILIPLFRLASNKSNFSLRRKVNLKQAIHTFVVDSMTGKIR